MKALVMCIGLVGACKRSEMPPIPDATVERWSKAVAAICDEPQVARKQYQGDTIASSEVRIVCTPKDEWGGAQQQHTGALIQLDVLGRPSRLEVQAFTGHGRAMALARRLLEAYGVRRELVERVMRQPGDDRSLAGDDMRIFVFRQHVQGELVLIDVTIDAQDVSDNDPVNEVVR